MEVVNEDEIDPLDAYMQEIDQQVQILDEKDKLKAQEIRMEASKSIESVKTTSTTTTIAESEEDEDEEETIGKAGNFATVEELIAYNQRFLGDRF